MTIIIDGKKAANKIKANIKKELDVLGVKPTLAIVLAGNNPASEIYVKNKIRQAEEIGITTNLIRFEQDVPELVVIAKVKELNNDFNTTGIIVQLPLPNQINPKEIIDIINPKKDVDGFHPINVGKLNIGIEKDALVPCTPKGCLHLLKAVEKDLSGKNVVVVGRSNIVGKPMAAMLVHENCTVTLANSHTKNLKALCQKSDIIISAVGKANLIKESFIKKDAILIDVAINKKGVSKSGKNILCGDMDFDAICNSGKAKAITPVPGGVGPMTIAMLLSNVLTAAKNK